MLKKADGVSEIDFIILGVCCIFFPQNYTQLVEQTNQN